MLAIIIEVFLPYEQRLFRTVPSARVCQMVYHWLAPVQLNASIKWKWCELRLFILVLLHLAFTLPLMHMQRASLFSQPSDQLLDPFFCGFVFL